MVKNVDKHMLKKPGYLFIKKWIERNFGNYNDDDFYYYVEKLKKIGLDLNNDYQCRKGGIDLHIHSNFSDGEYEPIVILLAAEYLGLSKISITDHNSILSYKNQLIKKSDYILPGVEIGTILNGVKIHLLCYGKALPDDIEFTTYLTEIQKAWNKRYVDVINQINSLYACSIPLDINIGKKETISNKEFIKHLELYLPESCSDVINLWNEKTGIYIQTDDYLPNTIDVIRKVSGCGGKIFLAHCNTLINENPFLLEKLKKEGLTGLEVMHSSYTLVEESKLILEAKKNDLLYSGGSDFHGNNNIVLGKGVDGENWVVPASFYHRSICQHHGIIVSATQQINADELSLDEKISLLVRPNLDIISKSSCSMYLCNEVYGRINKDRVSSERELFDEVKEVVMSNNHPILININQEGGRLNTINWCWDNIWPGNNAISCVKDWEVVINWIRGIAEELRAIGIRWNLSPVADIHNNSNNFTTKGRCFYGTPEHVAKYVKQYVTTMQECGVAATAKHFPGIGPINGDIHTTIPHITSIQETDLLPFYAAISADVAAIMVGNIVVDSIENIPAFMSHKVVNDILRKKMKYNGVIVTENISVPAMQDFGLTIGEVAVKSIVAGCDVVMFEPDITKENNTDFNTSKKTFINRKIITEAIKNAIKSRIISQERFNDAVFHVQTLYNKFGATPQTLQTYSEYMAIKKRNQKTKEQIADQSVSIYPNPRLCGDNLCINKNEKVLIIKANIKTNIRADSSHNHDIRIEFLIEKYLLNYNIVQVNKTIDLYSIDFSQYDEVICITYNFNMSILQKEIIKFLAPYYYKLILVDLGASIEDFNEVLGKIKCLALTKNANAYALKTVFEKIL